MPSFNATDHEYRYRTTVEGVVQSWTAWADVTAGMDNGDGTATIPVGDVNIDIGNLEVRVKALWGNPPGTVLTNAAAFTKVPVTPAAPTNGVVDDSNDTFTFTAAVK